MSMNNLTIDGEFRYIIKWFIEWSELQRDDFIPIAVDYITDKNEATPLDGSITVVNVNGLHDNEKPMSLFQCRIKLFNQWNKKWPQELKKKLQEKVTEIDSKVGDKIKDLINVKNNGGVGLTNGHDFEPYLEETRHDYENANDLQSKVEGQQKQQQQQVAHDVLVVTNSLALIDPMQEVLSNETSVDDIDPNDGQQMCNSKVTPNTNEDCTRESPSCTLRLNDNDNYQIAVEETRKPVEQVVQIQNLQISEEQHENEDVTASAEKSSTAAVTVTVNPVVVVTAQTVNAQNAAEVPLVV